MSGYANDDYSENDDNVSDVSFISPINRIDDPSYVLLRHKNSINLANRSRTPTNSASRIHYENVSVSFPSLKDDPFYCTINSINDNSFTIWIESKKTKKQWHLDVIESDLLKYASDPTGIPKITIIAKYLTNSFAKIESSSSIDAMYIVENDIEYINLHLTITHYILDEPWQLYFNFKLLPKDVNDTAKVESRLRDTNEEVNELRKQLKELKLLLATTIDIVKRNEHKYLSINGNDFGTVPRHAYGETPHNKVYFNGTGHSIINRTHFIVSTDRSEVQGNAIHRILNNNNNNYYYYYYYYYY